MPFGSHLSFRSRPKTSDSQDGPSNTKRRFNLLRRKKTKSSSDSSQAPDSGSTSKTTTVTTPSIKSGFRTRVQIHFENLPSYDYHHGYDASPNFVASEKICQGLISRIQHCSTELIARHDFGALDPLTTPRREAKPLRYRITYLVERDGVCVFDKSLRSYQNQPLTAEEAREVIAATDRIVALFLLRHDPGFKWVSSAEPESLVLGPETVQPCTGRPQSTFCVPRARFIHAKQLHEFVPGYSVEVFLRSRCPERYPESQNVSLKVDSCQATPLPILAGEDLMASVAAMLENPVHACIHHFDQRHQACQGLEGSGGCQHIDDGAVDIMFKVRNHLGPDYTYLSHRIQTSKVLFNDPQGRDFNEFKEQVQRRLETARDHADNEMNSKDDLIIRIRDLRGARWHGDDHIVFRLDGSTTHCRQTVEALLERLQTGISSVFEGRDVSATLVAHKRGHLIFDGVIGGYRDDEIPQEKFDSPDLEMKTFQTRLKDRIRADINLVCKDTCSLDCPDILPNMRVSTGRSPPSIMEPYSISDVLLSDHNPQALHSYHFAQKQSLRSLNTGSLAPSDASNRRVPLGAEVVKQYGYMSDYMADDDHMSEPPSTPSLADTESTAPPHDNFYVTPHRNNSDHNQGNTWLRMVGDTDGDSIHEMGMLDHELDNGLRIGRPLIAPAAKSSENPPKTPASKRSEVSLHHISDVDSIVAPSVHDSLGEPTEVEASPEIEATQGIDATLTIDEVSLEDSVPSVASSPTEDPVAEVDFMKELPTGVASAMAAPADGDLKNPPVDDTAAETFIVKDTPAVCNNLEESIINDILTAGTSTEDSSTEEIVAKNIPTIDTSMEDTIGEDISVEDTAMDTTVEGILTTDTSVKSNIVQDTVVNDAPVEDSPAEEIVVKNVPSMDTIKEDTIVDNISVEDTFEDTNIENIFNPDPSMENDPAEDANAPVTNSPVEDTVTKEIIVENASTMNISLDNTIVEDVPVEDTVVEDNLIEDIFAVDASIEDNTVEDAIVEEYLTRDTSLENNAAEDTVSEDISTADNYMDDVTVEGTIVESIIIDDTIIEDAVVEDVPIEETPVVDTPVEEIVGKGISTLNTSIDDTPVEHTNSEDISVSDTSMESKNIKNTVIIDVPAEGTAVKDTPIEDTPVEDTLVEDTPIEDTPVEGTIVDITEDVTIEETLIKCIATEDIPPRYNSMDSKAMEDITVECTSIACTTAEGAEEALTEDTPVEDTIVDKAITKAVPGESIPDTRPANEDVVHLAQELDRPPAAETTEAVVLDEPEALTVDVEQANNDELAQPSVQIEDDKPTEPIAEELVAQDVVDPRGNEFNESIKVESAQELDSSTILPPTSVAKAENNAPEKTDGSQALQVAIPAEEDVQTESYYDAEVEEKTHEQVDGPDIETEERCILAIRDSGISMGEPSPTSPDHESAKRDLPIDSSLEEDSQDDVMTSRYMLPVFVDNKRNAPKDDILETVPEAAETNVTTQTPSNSIIERPTSSALTIRTANKPFMFPPTSTSGLSPVERPSSAVSVSSTGSTHRRQISSPSVGFLGLNEPRILGMGLRSVLVPHQLRAMHQQPSFGSRPSSSASDYNF